MYCYLMPIRVMIYQSICPVCWDNCNSVKHAVSLGLLSNTILSCMVVGDDEN